MRAIAITASNTDMAPSFINNEPKINDASQTIIITFVCPECWQRKTPKTIAVKGALKVAGYFPGVETHIDVVSDVKIVVDDSPHFVASEM